MSVLKELLRKALDNIDARRARFDDRAIADAWVAAATREPEARLTTHKGLAIEVMREPDHNRVAYRAYLVGRRGNSIAWMHCMAPMAGRVQVTNANVYEMCGNDYRRKGIATAIYDLIERDVRAAGGEGLEPHWGSMSGEAIAFWEKRRPEYAGKLAELNRVGVAATGLSD
jgi:hypothetical protein